MTEIRDVYSRIAGKIIADLEQDRPWNAEHAAGRITRPLRCSPWLKITGRPASATPPSVIASRACSPCWMAAVEMVLRVRLARAAAIFAIFSLIAGRFRDGDAICQISTLKASLPQWSEWA
jgi:hypothetical protein